jgi:hypothetical protein
MVRIIRRDPARRLTGFGPYATLITTLADKGGIPASLREQLSKESDAATQAAYIQMIAENSLWVTAGGWLKTLQSLYGHLNHQAVIAKSQEEGMLLAGRKSTKHEAGVILIMNYVELPENMEGYYVRASNRFMIRVAAERGVALRPAPSARRMQLMNGMPVRS